MLSRGVFVSQNWFVLDWLVLYDYLAVVAGLWLGSSPIPQQTGKARADEAQGMLWPMRIHPRRHAKPYSSPKRNEQKEPELPAPRRG